MKPEDTRWDQVRLWELEYDRSHWIGLTPEEKLRLYDEMHEEVRQLCPEKLGLKEIGTPDDAYRDPHLAGILALRAGLLKVYGRKINDH